MKADNTRTWFCDKYKGKLDELIESFEKNFGSILESPHDEESEKRAKERRHIQWFFERMQLSELRKSNYKLEKRIEKLEEKTDGTKQ